MAHFIKIISLVLFSIMSVGCAADVASSGETSPESAMAPDATVDSATGMGCRNVEMQISGKDRACCTQTDEVPTDIDGSCGAVVAVGCMAPSGTCTFHSNDGRDFPCPAGTPCDVCKYDNDMANLASLCH